MANKEKPYKWINEEIGPALINIKPIITEALQDRLNLILDKLIIIPLVLTPFYNPLLAI